jgi:hypothetical protein
MRAERQPTIPNHNQSQASMDARQLTSDASPDNLTDEDVRFLVLLSTAAKCAIVRLEAAAPPALLQRFVDFAWSRAQQILLSLRHPTFFYPRFLS